MESEIIELTDENGKKIEFKILDIIEKDDDEYIVALPKGSKDEVVIFKVMETADGNADYIDVTDEDISDEIFNEFVERNK